MNLALLLLVSAVAGGVLCGIHHAALWFCVSRLSESHHPASLMAAGLFVRLLIALTTFALLLRWGGWLAPVIALVGFVVVRQVILWRCRYLPPKIGAGP
jgi:F1F0 ATPase subunit 2